MNIETGELFAVNDEQELQTLKEKEGQFLKEVPEEHAAEATAILAGRKSAQVDLRSSSPLAGWANKERKAARKKSRAKMAKVSRKRNRRKS